MKRVWSQKNSTWNIKETSDDFNSSKNEVLLFDNRVTDRNTHKMGDFFVNTGNHTPLLKYWYGKGLEPER